MDSLSSLSTRSIEEVAGFTQGPKCFQVYVMKDRGLLQEFIERARAARYTALILTIDVPVPGNRQRDLVHGMTLPPRIGVGTVLDAARHPAWSLNYLFRQKHELANISHRIDEGSSEASSVIQYLTNQIDRKLDWDDAAWMIERWQGPFAVKGVQSIEDARRAVEVGASSVIISNHGGRQLDFVPATIDLVTEIADAVGDQVEVVMDGGIRRGTDVNKALACGARACMIGRAYLYGLGAGGEAGVDRALEILRTEFERDMALLGCTSVNQIKPRHLRRVATSRNDH
jgi:L-lactate dehydrogenase (cytochrome)